MLLCRLRLIFARSPPVRRPPVVFVKVPIVTRELLLKPMVEVIHSSVFHLVKKKKF